MPSIPNFTIIGAGPEAVEHLRSGQDACFGRLFQKSNSVCQSCRAPTIVDKKVVLMKELCAATTFNTPGISRLNKLTSQEVLHRLESNVPVEDIYLEILADCEPRQLGAEARVLLVDRLTYLKGRGMDVPPVPRSEVMLLKRKKP